MDVRFLESLIKVIEHGSIASAARAQNLTSTAVSQRIKVLETELGCALLSRVGHTAIPTEHCLKLEARARQIIYQSACLQHDVTNTNIAGPLKLGAISTALTDFIPSLAAYFAETAENVELFVVPGTSKTLYEALTKQVIDGAIIVQPSFNLPKQFHSELIATQPLCLISPKTMSDIPAEEALKSKPVIVYDRNSWGGKQAWSWLSSLQTHCNIVCELDALETIAIMVEQGLGVAIVPEWNDLSTRYEVACQRLPSSATSYKRKIAFVSHRGAPAQSLLTLCADLLLTSR